MSDNNVDCVAVRCGDCKRVVYLAVNEPDVMDTDAFKEIGKMVARGCTVEHMPVPEARKSDFGCQCNRRRV